MDKKGTNIIIKSSVWYTLSNFLLKGLNFITIPIFTRLLTKDEFGSYSNFTSWLSILMIISTVSLSASLVSARFDFKNNLDSYILSILSLGSIITLGVYGIIRLNINFFESLLSTDRFYIDFIFMYILVSQAVEVFQSTQRFQYKYKSSVLVSITTSLTSVLFSLFLVILLKDKLFGRIVGHYVPLIAINIFFYILYIINGKRISIDHWKYALKICIPFVPHLLSMTVLSASDHAIITYILGPSDTALYSLAYSIASVVTILWSSINTAFSPWLGEKIHNNDTKSVYNVSTIYVLIIAIPIIGIVLIAPELLKIMGGESYLSAMYVMPPVMLGCFFQYVYTMYVNIEQFKKKTVGMAIASVSAAALNIILNFIFIPVYGYIAAAYTTMLSYAFLLVFHYFLVRKMGLAILYNTKNIFYIIFGEVVVVLFINLLYINDTARYLVIIIYIVILIILFVKHGRYILTFLKK